jgi:hypothetical protein
MMIRKLICALIACLGIASVLAVELQPANTHTNATASAKGERDSKQIEKDLQHLPWKQFKSVVESIPRIKADIEAYGPIGWQFVQANYATYPWKKNIDRLDEAQKKHLTELIQTAKRSR